MDVFSDERVRGADCTDLHDRSAGRAIVQRQQLSKSESSPPLVFKQGVPRRRSAEATDAAFPELSGISAPPLGPRRVVPGPFRVTYGRRGRRKQMLRMADEFAASASEELPSQRPEDPARQRTPTSCKTEADTVEDQPQVSAELSAEEMLKAEQERRKANRKKKKEKPVEEEEEVEVDVWQWCRQFPKYSTATTQASASSESPKGKFAGELTPSGGAKSQVSLGHSLSSSAIGPNVRSHGTKDVSSPSREWDNRHHLVPSVNQQLPKGSRRFFPGFPKRQDHVGPNGDGQRLPKSAISAAINPFCCNTPTRLEPLAGTMSDSEGATRPWNDRCVYGLHVNNDILYVQQRTSFSEASPFEKAPSQRWRRHTEQQVASGIWAPAVCRKPPILDFSGADQ